MRFLSSLVIPGRCPLSISAFLDPVAECLGIDAELLADACQGAARFSGFRTQLEDHRDRTFPQLRGVLLPT